MSTPADPLTAGREAAARVSNQPSPIGRHRAPEPPTPAAVAGVTADTDINNPVNHYGANVFPVGAAITVVYGSSEYMFCTLGNLYRITGFLNNHPADDGVPVLTRGVSDGGPGKDVADNVVTVDDVIDANRRHVADQLPEVLQPNRIGDTGLPMLDAPDDDKLAWLAELAADHGITTVTLTAPPRPEEPDA